MQTKQEKLEEPATEEVEEIIKRSMNRKAPETDDINTELIKYGGRRLHEEICELMRVT